MKYDIAISLKSHIPLGFQIKLQNIYLDMQFHDNEKYNKKYS
jgi:hypothetical protein